MTQKTTQRKSNFELLRIISMCGIIAIHYISTDLGGMLQDPAFPNFEWLLRQFVLSTAAPLVNCFVLISGYFLITKNQFNLRKSIELLIITGFYGTLGYFIGLYYGTASFSFKGLLYAFFPFFDGKRWFVETYIILILIAPFINKVITNISKKSFQALLSVQLTFFCVWYSVGQCTPVFSINLSAPILDNGYGIINFISLYLLGAYFRLYLSESIIYKLSRIKLLLGYIVCCALNFLASYFINPFGYCFVTNILSSVFIFLLFEKTNLGYNKPINLFGAAAFDVYFIHGDSYTSRLLVQNLFQGKLFIGTLMIIPLLISITAFYLLGIVMYKLRSFIFEKSIDKLLNRCSVINANISV